MSELVWKLKCSLAMLSFVLLPFGDTAFFVADWLVGANDE